ncbi:MAG: hypothetical protein CHACPFDD_00555 [Phycisphaerae bacterium]|nr:hypothetical protein [Phycisphaerae bacterium]
MKIDLHTHILPETWPDLVERYGYPGWVRIEHHAPCRARLLIGERVFREVEENCWSPARRREDCARSRVDVQVLSTVPVMFSYWAKAADALDLARRLNDHLAAVIAADPQHFLGLATIPMQDADLAIRELERCVTPSRSGGLGLSGVQIGTNVNGANLDDAAVRPVFEAAESLGAAVFVHPWEMLGRERMPKYWLPWLVGMPAETCLAICSMIFGGVLERLPRLRVCFAHGGGSFAGTIGRIGHGFAARPDLCAVDCAVPPEAYLAGPTGATNSDGTPEIRPARFYVDSLTHDAAALARLVELFSARRVALGSDYPFPLGEAIPGACVESLAGLSEQQRASILSGTALEFLGAERPAAVA